MRKTVTIALLFLIGLVAVGLLSLQAASAGQADDEVTKRDDDTPDLVLVADDDDDDTFGPDRKGADTRTNTGPGASRVTEDDTRSRVTAGTRDRSRDDTRR